MPFPTYTRADLTARVLARLVEVGVASGAAAGSGYAAAPYTQAQVIDRALARLGEIGFDFIGPGGLTPFTLDQLYDRVLARLGETGFDFDTSVVPPTIARTLEDLIERALVRLGEVGFGQAAEPEAADRMRELAPEVLAELVKRRVYLPITEPIPPEGFDALATILASHASSDFGLPADEIALLAQRAQAAEQTLQRILFEYQGRVTQISFSVLAELAADRLFSYPVGGAIAQEAFDAISAIVASRAADDLKVDAGLRQALSAEETAGTAKLRRLAYGYKARVTAALPGIIADLQGSLVYTFPADGSVPAEAADALSDIVSARMASDFELDAGQRQILAAEAEAGRKRLVMLGMPARITAAVPAILADLYTDKVYAFPADDVIRPDAFDGLAAICAGRLASEFAPEKAQILIPEMQAAEMRLRRMRAQPAPSRTLRMEYF